MEDRGAREIETQKETTTETQDERPEQPQPNDIYPGKQDRDALDGILAEANAVERFPDEDTSDKPFIFTRKCQDANGIEKWLQAYFDVNQMPSAERGHGDLFLEAIVPIVIGGTTKLHLFMGCWAADAQAAGTAIALLDARYREIIQNG